MKTAGAQGITRSRVPLIAMLALAASIGLAGCEGDDGKDGATGQQGPAGTAGTPGAAGATGATGPTGPTGPVAGNEKPLESCAVCHGENSLADAKAGHAVTGIATVSNVVFTAVGPDLQISYTVKVDGQNSTSFLTLGSDYRYTAGATVDAGANAPAPGLTAGDYTITIPGGVAAAGTASRFFFRVVSSATTPAIAAVVSGDYPAAALPALVSNQSCNNCHSDAGVAPHTSFGYPGMQASECVVCHKATSGLSFLSFDDSWVGLVHGIHASHGMPTGDYDYGTEKFEVSYPSYMTNCSVCHDSPTTLAAANTMTVSGANCFSCHESMDSWDFTESGTTFHEAYDETTNCQTCHNSTPSGIAPATVTAFHDGLETERIGIIWGGEDKSVSEGKKFTSWEITNIVDNGATLAISWTATFNGTPINPCNTTVSATAPVIFPYGPNTANEGGTSMLRTYVQGDDYILGKASSPGQPSATSLSTTNTVCASNVATTTIPVDTGVTAGSRAVVALQGKWQVPVPTGFSSSMHAADWPYTVMFVRVPTPVREWVVGTGALPSAQRRAIADTGACLKCHVGSLYQHGNTRVDNVRLCVMCHNPASSDQNNRVTMGVDKTEAYDGLVGQTYEFKSYLHALHNVDIEKLNPLKKPVLIYRTRGIFAWAPEGVTPPNWTAGTACQVVSPIAPATTPAAFVDLAPFEAIPAGMELTRTGNIVYGASTITGGAYPTVACQTHTLYHPTYPRLANDCAACHGSIPFDVMVDQTKGVATTIDAGVAPFNNQLDDTLQGANSAACTSCHRDAASVGHADQNGWVPAKFPNGRQTIIDAAK